ncbi:TlpA disulfide reductase family protein [Cellulophaga sp. E6(2014)]|uniref:TlpA family protein disulfide reductase n=1 Tax=Cellulophaga sp. E6(2014) TaxID=1495334 RepID=UPI00051E0E4A|nr:TlpA disulfide reductase family protein [Cellulophaga sp. E6(2014)]KGK30297.1 hypothetical protein EL45_10990 [Cellulophaga sp. E6(2014)]
MEVIEVKLVNSVSPNDLFGSEYTEFHFRSYYKEYPDYYNYLLSYEGIPKNYEGLIMNYNYSNYNFTNAIERIEAHTAKNKTKINYDSLIEIKDGLIAYVGVDAREQIVIIDANNNKNFKDDKIFKFRKGFNYSQELESNRLNKYPILDYEYITNNKESISNHKRKVSIYPNSAHEFNSFFEDALSVELHIMGKLNDYWKGSFSYKKKSYNILFQGFDNNYLQIFIAPDSIKIRNNNSFDKEKFGFKVKDTIKLSGDLFLIETPKLEKNKILLKKIKNLDIKTFGFRVGDKVEKIPLKDLELNPFDPLLFEQKTDYVLLDFWGTWCGACKLTNPLLRKIYANNKENIHLVSVAYDNNVAMVKDYVIEENMNWTHAFIKREENVAILKKLRVEAFPTFILINNKNEIVFRGTSLESLQKIELIINESKTILQN